jgi:hypothetical protein
VHGAVAPLHPAIVGSDEVLRQLGQRSLVPIWLPWPLPMGWLVSGVRHAGDEHTGPVATVLACSGPNPLTVDVDDLSADLLLVAEQPGVGLGARFSGIPGPDPGELLAEAMAGGHSGPHAKVPVGGHPTPLWCVKSPADRSAYVSEARGMWLYAVAWPASAGYIFADHVVLHDLTEWIPPELVYGAPSPYLHGRV